MSCRTPGFPVLDHLPEFAQVHIHWVSAFLRGIFLTWGSNPNLLRLLPCRRILYHWATREAYIPYNSLTYLYLSIYVHFFITYFGSKHRETVCLFKTETRQWYTSREKRVWASSLMRRSLVHLFKVYNSVALTTFTKLCIHHHNQGIFSFLQEETPSLPIPFRLTSP